MIVRYTLSCAECSACIRLRIGLRDAEQEEISFGCDRCGNSIKGTLALEPEKGNFGPLSITGGTIVDTDAPDPEQIVTVDRRFALPLAGEEQASFSSFLTAIKRLGFDQVVQRLGRQRETLELVKDQLPVLKRLQHTYFRRNWTTFEHIVRENISDDMPLEMMPDRQAALYMQLQWVVNPLYGSKPFLSFAQDLNLLLMQQLLADPQGTTDYVSEGFIHALTEKIQKECFSVTIRVLQNINLFDVALIEWLPEEPELPFPSAVGVTASAETFHLLKALYVDAFETASRGITLVMGLLNMVHRGSFDTFPVHPTLKNYKPATLQQFHKMSNAPKLEFLRGTLLDSWPHGRLDPVFRNSIGHHDAHLDETDSTIACPSKDGLTFSKVGFGEFQFRVLRAILAVHQINHVTKLLNEHFWLATKT